MRSTHPTTPSFGAEDSGALVLGDLDGDGDLDAVVANRNSEAETVWLNDRARPTVNLLSSANPSIPSQSVTFTATVTPAGTGSGTPTGTVPFTIDGTPQPPVPLASGQASFSTSSLSVGSHMVSATYNGTASFL